MNLADLTDYSAPAATGFDPIPTGDYEMILKESEIRKSKPTANDPNGVYLWCKCEIVEGQFKGRIVFENIMLKHMNPKVVQIGQGQLASLRHATGKPEARESSEMHDIRVIGRVSVKGDENSIQSFKPANPALAAQQSMGAAPNAQPQQQAAPQQQAPAQQQAAPAANAGGFPFNPGQ